jgi:lipoic acid synthetase
MGLRYVVITSVTRDDLPDGGASHYAEVIRAIRTENQGVRVEVLIPDFEGNPEALGKVLNESPDVLNHNVETVPRLYPEVRPQADYFRSLRLLKHSKKQCPEVLTKSGFMLGLGEDRGEVLNLMKDLRNVGCDLLTIGQYLQPRSDRLPVLRYVTPDEFDEWRKAGEEMGFQSVASGPFVRSSFHASQMFDNKLTTEG